MNAAPTFVPCGKIVGVVRSAYKAVVRWFPGGPKGLIRYYFVPKENGFFTGLNRFWPWSQELDIVNETAAGEVTSHGRTWDRGEPPIPALVHEPEGTPAEFEGNGTITWSPPSPTPAHLLPGCIRPPMHLPIRIGLSAVAGVYPAGTVLLTGGLRIGLSAVVSSAGDPLEVESAMSLRIGLESHDPIATDSGGLRIGLYEGREPLSALLSPMGFRIGLSAEVTDG